MIQKPRHDECLSQTPTCKRTFTGGISFSNRTHLVSAVGYSLYSIATSTTLELQEAARRSRPGMIDSLQSFKQSTQNLAYRSQIITPWRSRSQSLDVRSVVQAALSSHTSSVLKITPTRMPAVRTSCASHAISLSRSRTCVGRWHFLRGLRICAVCVNSVVRTWLTTMFTVL